MKDTGCALGILAGGVEPVTGKFGVMDGVTGTLVGIGPRADASSDVILTWPRMFMASTMLAAAIIAWRVAPPC